MKVSFSRTITGDEENLLTLEKTEDNKFVVIECSYRGFFDGKNNSISYYSLNKKQLHDFIGALLHIQQKMKGGDNG